MVSEEKVTVFLKLQQIVLDIEDSGSLIDQFLPRVLEELKLVGYGYVFLSAIFIDADQKVKQSFFLDAQNKKVEKTIREDDLFQKEKEWVMKVMYGEAAVVSDVKHFISPAYSGFTQVHSVLIFPIMQLRKLTGVLILGSNNEANGIDTEEIEFGTMITRLVDLAFRLQDTENSLTNISQQVYEMNAKLHQLDKLKDDFVSIASHELRTPMTAIRSYAWMALHKSDIPLSQKLERYLYRTLVSTERLINLVNDMLNVSRIESGKIEIDPKAFDIVTLVKDVIEEVKVKAEEKKLVISLAEHALPPIFADVDKVHQILLNLIGNSLKFCYPSGLITIDFFVSENMIEVSVKDNGAGIAKDDLVKLFHKFSRLDSSYTAVGTSGGTGLGLYISKSLIELMHGQIRAFSEGVDKGATFTFSLPIATKEIIASSEKYHIKPEGGEAKLLEPVAI